MTKKEELLSKGYEFAEVEEKWLAKWQEVGKFCRNNGSRQTGLFNSYSPAQRHRCAACRSCLEQYSAGYPDSLSPHVR